MSDCFEFAVVTIEQFYQRIDPESETLSDDSIETALRLELWENGLPSLLRPIELFYQVSKAKRDDAFRKI